jgi:hypothetical protein
MKPLIVRAVTLLAIILPLSLAQAVITKGAGDK